MTAVLESPPQRQPGRPWTVDEAAEFLTVSGKHLRRQIELGEVRATRIGKRIIVPDSEVRRLAEGVAAS